MEMKIAKASVISPTTGKAWAVVARALFVVWPGFTEEVILFSKDCGSAVVPVFAHPADRRVRVQAGQNRLQRGVPGPLPGRHDCGSARISATRSRSGTRAWTQGSGTSAIPSVLAGSLRYLLSLSAAWASPSGVTPVSTAAATTADHAAGMYARTSRIVSAVWLSRAVVGSETTHEYSPCATTSDSVEPGT